MSTNHQNKEEEVDLGSLFIIIGNGFKKLFNFIWKVLLGLFDFIIAILLFIKGNIVKLTIAAIIGAGIGTFLEYKKETTYGSDLLVEPNFKSSRQLYNNVSFYNDLIKQKDTSSLVKIFKIDKNQAGSLRKFEVSPVVTDNDVLELYDELILSVDTLTAKSYSFAQFKKVFTDYDYKVHAIHVEATDNKVFSKLDDVIISSIVENEYFNRLKKLTRENLYRTDSLLKSNLVQIDSLRKVYMEVLLEEAGKESSGTTIDLGGENRTTKELELFQTNRTINKDLKEVSEEISEKSEVINVISNFQPVGYEIKGIERNYIFILAGAGMLIVFAFLMLKALNTYLEEYKNK
ncbi:hypothetical protein AAON49_12775 [Pseudotenacibaculum sp. MALMAid0570]|uniref:hypothetical protein n=1 Tax=Pseudotenacibaculum sp. MALMAid0570 TaxID=3143938 RepID=UPI0032DE2F9C